MTSEPSPSQSIVSLVRDGVLDAELAGLFWLLAEGRLPLVVVGRGSAAEGVLDALLVFVPPDARVVTLAGADEDFGWLPEAAELGWRRESPASSSTQPRPRDPATRPERTVLLARGLGAATPGPQARLAIRALSVGYGMAATVEGDRLEDLFARLGGPAVGATDDELSRLGVVVALGTAGEDVDLRVTAAHFLRPVARDEHGHVQRLPPAVLAAYEPRTDRLEHFAWGVTAELATRVDRAPKDLEREQAERAGVLAGLMRAGTVDPDDVADAIGSAMEAAGRPAPDADRPV